MDPVASNGMTPRRARLAKIAAISVLRSYGKDRAIRRVRDMGDGVRDLNDGNRDFYARIEELVREGIEHDTIDGESLSWRR